MDGPWGEDPDVIRARIREQVREAEARARAARAFSDDVATLRISGRDRRGEVGVEVDPGGHLLSLSLSPATQGRSLAEVEQAVMEAYGDGTRRVAQEMARRAADTFGPGSDTAAFLRSTFSEQLDGLGR